MNYRDFLQKLIYNIINPLIKGMIFVGITPNIVTFVGFLGNCAATALFVLAALHPEQAMWYFGCGGWVILFAGLFDMMDGRLARMSGKSSVFGALWDSTLDRYSELVSLCGIAYYFFATEGMQMWGLVTFFAMMGSVMVSYVRARAEGLQIECKVGLMQRPERVVLTALGGILAGALDNVVYMIVPIALIALLANITAFWRILHCYNQLKGK